MQQLDPEAFADMVLQTVDAALAPVLQRLAASEAKLQMLGDVRDRVVTMEAKSAAAPVSVAPHELEALRQSLIVEIEKRSAAAADGIAGVRDRVSVIETKAASTPVVIQTDIDEPLVMRIASIEKRLDALNVSSDWIKDAERHAIELSRLDSHLEQINGRQSRLEIKLNELPGAKDYADLRERVAVAEVFSRQPGPQGPQGPAGKDGLDGKDGLNGKDGANGLNGKDGADGAPGRDGVDGVSLDDLSVVQEDDRTLIVRGTVGAKVKDIGSVTFPVDIYRGVWIEGKQYNRGDGTTWAGSEWHCNRTTTAKPGDGSKDWTLKVKKGRDGRDGKDAPGALPVVKV